MSQSEDHTFIRQFGSIVIGLVLLTITLIFVARSIHAEPDDAGANSSLKASVEQRIRPVSSVYTNTESAPAPAETPTTTASTPAPAEAATTVAPVSTAVETPATAASAPAVAEAPAATAPVVDGEKIYNGLCVGCHAAGVAGAPIAGSEQMGQRFSEKGIDTLMTNAINGFNVMPPRGGNPGLTDEQIRAAIEFMLP